MDRHLSLELVRVTEAAAAASGRWMGRGQKLDADQAATTAMRTVFDTLPIEGTVVIGEGEMDEAPMLYIGEQVGMKGIGLPQVDVAVDPLEGTSILAKGLWNALSVVAIAEKGCLLHAPDMYMEKLAVGPRAVGKISIDAPLKDNLNEVALANNKNVEDLVVVILDRERHTKLIKDVRELGARIKLISDGDVAAAINTGFFDTDVDVLMGSGGAPEGVLAAVALKCLEGEIQARLLPESEEQYNRCLKMGITDPSKTLYMDDLVKGDDAIFAATGITDGELLKGVRYHDNKAITDSVVMRSKTGTLRFVKATHLLSKKPELCI